MKALQARARQAPRSAVDETPLPLPKSSRRREPRVRELDAEKLKKLWRDPQRLKHILGESDPD